MMEWAKSLATLLLITACRIPLPDVPQQYDAAVPQKVTTALDRTSIRHRRGTVSVDTFYDFSGDGIDIVGTTEMAYEDPTDKTHDALYPHVISGTRMLLYGKEGKKEAYIVYNRSTIHIPKRSKELFPATLSVEIDEGLHEFKDVYEISGLLEGVHRKPDVTILVEHRAALPQCSNFGYLGDTLLLTEKGGLVDEYRCSPETPLQPSELPLQDLARKILTITEQADARDSLLKKVHL